MNNIIRLNLLIFAIGLLFAITPFFVEATVPSKPARLYIQETLLSNSSVYLVGEDEALISSQTLSNSQINEIKILANLNNFPNESKIKVYFEPSKGNEVILAEDSIRNLTINGEFFDFFQETGDTPLRFFYITQAGLDNQTIKTSSCTPNQLKQIITTLHEKKSFMNRAGVICYSPIIRFPEIDISKIYNFEDKEGLNNSRLALKIDNSVYREYLLSYEPPFLGGGPAPMINPIQILLFVLLIAVAIAISAFLLIKFLRNKKKKNRGMST